MFKLWINQKICINFIFYSRQCESELSLCKTKYEIETLHLIEDLESSNSKLKVFNYPIIVFRLAKNKISRKKEYKLASKEKGIAFTRYLKHR